VELLAPGTPPMVTEPGAPWGYASIAAAVAAGGMDEESIANG